MTIIIADRRVSKSSVNDQRARIQANISDFHRYFRDNYRSFHKWRNLVFNTSLSPQEISVNNELGRPTVEFNIVESYVSRLLGEYIKSEPNLEVSQSDSAVKPVDPQLIQLVEQHIRSIIFESNRENMLYELYRDILGGGFSAIKMFTEYQNENSMDQDIRMKRCADPTMVGFDKMALDPHKGDGMYCYECFPMNKSEFEDKYGKKYTEGMTFTSNKDDEFSWAYKGGKNDIVMLVDYWEKKITTKKIVKVRKVDPQNPYSQPTDEVMSVKDYESLVDNWQHLIPPPAVVGKERETEIVSICRHRLIKDATLEYAETDYKYLPLIFCDGNSIMLRGTDGKGDVRQMTRPMPYNMLGIQKMKNFLGTMIANHIENTPQSQWLIEEHTIPDQEDYQDAWTNPQKASTLVWKGYSNEDPDKQLPMPNQLQARPLPPGMLEMFNNLDSLAQTISGTYDAALGINDNQLSGTAIANGSTQSNAATSHLKVGLMSALNRAAEFIVDVMPKYYTGVRQLSLRDSTGKQKMAMINGDSPTKIDYDPLSMKVKVEAGINFELQRTQALAGLQNLMSTVPVIGQFITTQEPGVEMLLNNYDIRGIDALKEEIKPFIQQQQQQQQQSQQAQQMQMQQQQQAQQLMQQKAQMEEQLAQAKQNLMQMQAQKMQADTQYRISEQQIKQMEAQIRQYQAQTNAEIGEYNAETGRLNVVRQAKEGALNVDLGQAKVQSENIRTAFDMSQSAIKRETDMTKRTSV